ncbi:crossover junction endodeoxyribonuclease RuvC [Changpingibacter yushuensis]|uniref:crossover junction endodeoxyribonuclease RuvC n=1 Tax=Changpingibacter yushuensis TaxID=2758440 RepID=UPI0015F510F4|nr:crossover junction endodeoxyribonuclease RuvC [Changpingibacter yushuensis]
MRILGVDPGMTRCGFGTIDTEGGRRVQLVDMRVVRSAAELAPHKRLLIIADGLDEVMEEFKPDVVAVERVFAQSNVRSVTGTAQVAGIVMLAAARASLPLGMHTPSEVKAAVTGSGRADKRQVQIMVQRILRMTELPRPADAADSLAIAITQAWRGGADSLHAEPDRAQHGGAGTLPRATGRDLTEAQKLWAGAERMSRRHGAVAPRAK